jgi:hypothetical protein
VVVEEVVVAPPLPPAPPLVHAVARARGEDTARRRRVRKVMGQGKAAPVPGVARGISGEIPGD